MKQINRCAALAALFGTLMTAPLAQAQQIDARPLTPRDVHDYGLPDGTQLSGGLLVVGLGEAVYLEAHVDVGLTVSGVTWSIEERPLGGSTAQLQPSPLPIDMPIFSPGDRVIYQVAGRQMFMPDIEGKYQVKAIVNTSDGTVEITTQVTGARYVGVGTLGGASPAYPQCALCHEEQALGWMGTGHADYFTRAIDGEISSHYGESCTDCHTLGLNRTGDNGNFWSVAAELGWTFPETLEAGNWEALPMELKAMSNVQCEHCHGPGSIHHGDSTTTAVSLSAGDCGQCHDEDPYYYQTIQWSISGHAVATRYPTGPGRGSCVECHSGIGFIESIKGKEERSTDYEAVTCAVCHDVHNPETPSLLRTVENVVLNNGEEVTVGGRGKLCMNCHKSRRDAETYTQQYARHYGPHYSCQTDMLLGTNAVEYGKVIGSTSHIYATEDACATCHMHELDRNDPSFQRVGGHTFKPVSDNGTPDDPSDDFDMTAACVDCHGPMESFDMARSDFNYDGIVEGVKTEIGHLLHALAMKLPPIGEDSVVVAEDYTPAELKAAFNYLFVEEDGSHGIHNPQYAAGILRASINDVSDPFNHLFSGINIPMGGKWFYSQWFEFYAPQVGTGWIFHYDHGWLYVSGDPDKIWLYESRTNQWWYTTPDTYPTLFDSASNSWLYFGGRVDGLRFFYNFSTGQWTSVE